MRRKILTLKTLTFNTGRTAICVGTYSYPRVVQNQFRCYFIFFNSSEGCGFCLPLCRSSSNQCYVASGSIHSRASSFCLENMFFSDTSHFIKSSFRSTNIGSVDIQIASTKHGLLHLDTVKERRGVIRYSDVR